MEHLELLLAIEEKINQIIHSEKLHPLRGIGGSYDFEDKNILEWYYKAVDQNADQSIEPTIARRKYRILLDDLFICSDQIVVGIAHIFLYRPFINNPLNDCFIHEGRKIFTLFQTFSDKRYNMYEDIVIQSIYNYWDRIGDLIASYFPNLLEERKIFFPTAVQCIPSQFHSSVNYLWLKNFKDNEYKVLNQKRKQVVHYTSSNTERFDIYMRNDEAEIILTQSQKEALPTYFKSHLELSLQGFKRAILLIEEFNMASLNVLL